MRNLKMLPRIYLLHCKYCQPNINSWELSGEKNVFKLKNLPDSIDPKYVFDSAIEPLILLKDKKRKLRNAMK